MLRSRSRISTWTITEGKHSKLTWEINCLELNKQVELSPSPAPRSSTYEPAIEHCAIILGQRRLKTTLGNSNRDLLSRPVHTLLRRNLKTEVSLWKRSECFPSTATFRKSFVLFIHLAHRFARLAILTLTLTGSTCGESTVRTTLEEFKNASYN